MIKLRDKTEVKDRRFDRLIDFDPRSRNFPISTTVEGKKPRSYTWRCNKVLDQGPDGACVGFGCGAELIARPSEVKNIDYNYCKNQIYWEAQKIDQWDGGSYPGARPFYEGTSVLAGVRVLHRIGWMESYRWAFSFNDLLLGVGYNGPAIIGTYWYDGMYEPDSKGFIRPTGRILGGHCTLVRAVSVRKEMFTIRNSWSDAWGKKGDCYMTFTDMERLMKADGEAVFLLKRHRELN